MKKVILIFSTLILMCPAAFAYNWGTCSGNFVYFWPGTAVNFHASAIGFPAGNTYQIALNSVVSKWNAAPSKFTYSVTYGDTSVGMNNGESEIWWQASLPEDFLGYTQYWANGLCQIYEADVIFRNTVPYTTSTNKANLDSYGGQYTSFQAVAMHELGHAQGLAHTNTIYNVMGDALKHVHTNGDTVTSYPGEDAVNGSMKIYGAELGKEDVGVAHWRYTGTNGEYSTHGPVRVFDANGNALSKVILLKESTYNVKKGQTIKLEMTYENMGQTSPITASVNYYISTDSTISTNDTYIGSGSVKLYRDVPNTTSNTTLVLPNNLTSSKLYYIGVIIDPGNQIVEITESNNRTYVRIWVSN
jgi:hypothetical protein